MPFAPFTGLNHHCQLILFGCALLQDETEQTFVWLFETWLQAMWAKEPKSIITDQDFFGNLFLSQLPKKVFYVLNQSLPFFLSYNDYPPPLRI